MTRKIRERRQTQAPHGRRWRDPHPEPMDRGWTAVLVMSLLLLALACFGAAGMFDGWLQ